VVQLIPADVTEFVTVKVPLGAAAALNAIWTRYNA
jgi:hypothetical protein